MTKLCYVDCETTGLDPDRHQVWELAIIVEDPGEDPKEYVWQVPVDLSLADPNALRIGRFYERRLKVNPIVNQARMHSVLWPSDEKWTSAGALETTAETVAGLLDGAHMVGATPSFDASFLAPWLRAHGQCPTWHYHLVDIEALAAGRVAGACMGESPDGNRGIAVRGSDDLTYVTGEPPWKSSDLSLAVGVDPGDYDRHTALGDAKWARGVYRAVMGLS